MRSEVEADDEPYLSLDRLAQCSKDVMEQLLTLRQGDGQ